MTTDRDRFRVELDVEAGKSGSTRAPSAERESAPASGPFRIALLGDFSGRSHRGLLDAGRTLAARRPVRIDRDDLDDAIAHLAPTLAVALSPGAEPVTLSFTSLDEFHPDSLFQRLPLFRALRDAEQRAAAGASLGDTARGAAADTPAGVLDAILGDVPLPPGGAALARPVTRPALEPADGGLSAFVSQAVAGHIVRQPGDAELAARAAAEDAIAATMRALLHHPDFQALEALWRGAAMLAARLDTDAMLQIHLVDVSATELAADLAGAAPDESGIYRLLTGAGRGPWTLLAALFPLGDDPAFVTKLAEVARDVGAPLVAGAHPLLAGVEDLGSTPDPDDWSADQTSGWDDARASTGATSIALVFPRLLLRLPYGSEAQPCELFPFEEHPAGAHPHHDELLWGSGALAAALVVGEGFGESGWNLQPAGEISRLPLHIYRVNGESLAVPCAEIVMGERAADRLRDQGLSPLLGVRDSDSVVLPMLQSITPRRAPLAARWNQAS